jgi:hypothetical protein
LARRNTVKEYWNKFNIFGGIEHKTNSFFLQRPDFALVEKDVLK